ncbi:MAG: xanthine dehydrogenase [Ruminococcaceae bacterium]|nr:xanthine dehydrogenase [Oscillospiraceae bacterium]
MLQIERYIRAETPAQAYELCRKKSNVILGGMLWLKQQNRRVSTAVDLCGLGLDKIEETEDSIRIGAMVSLRDMETHPALNALCGSAIADSLCRIVGVQFRNLATVGGSVFGRFGFSDVLTVLMALDAQVVLYNGGTIPLTQFAAMKPERDVLLYILIPKTPVQAVYLSQRITATDFPVLNLAISRREGELRCVIGARPLRAVSFGDDKQLLGEHITEESARAYAEDIASRIILAGNRRAGEAYRRDLCRVLVRRGLLALEDK